LPDKMGLATRGLKAISKELCSTSMPSGISIWQFSFKENCEGKVTHLSSGFCSSSTSGDPETPAHGLRLLTQVSSCRKGAAKRLTLSRRERSKPMGKVLKAYFFLFSLVNPLDVGLVNLLRGFCSDEM